MHFIPDDDLMNVEMKRSRRMMMRGRLIVADAQNETTEKILSRNNSCFIIIVIIIIIVTITIIIIITIIITIFIVEWQN